jgi:hypothetical protein
MMMHNVTMTRKIKEQSILIRGFFRVVTKMKEDSAVEASGGEAEDRGSGRRRLGR